MTIRTLFGIILKVLGIFFIKYIIDLIPQFISVASIMTERDSGDMRVFFYVSLFAILAAYVFTVYMLIFQTDAVIDKLKLDIGFSENTILSNLHRSTILSISIIVIGGLLFVYEIPNLCRNLFSYFQEKKMTHGMTKPSLVNIIVSVVKILIGLLLMGEQKRIVNLIENKRRK